MPKTLRPVQPVAVTGPEVLNQDMTARDICDTLKRLRFRNGPQVIALGDKEASISPSRDPTGAMNGRRCVIYRRPDGIGRAEICSQYRRITRRVAPEILEPRG